MRHNGLGFIRFLIVALLVAFLVMSNMKSMKTTTTDTQQTIEQDPVGSAQDVVNQLNEKIGIGQDTEN